MKAQLLLFVSGYLSKLDEIHEVPAEAKLLDLMDSLEVFDLVSAISNEFHIRIPEDEILLGGEFRKMTVQNLIDFVYDSSIHSIKDQLQPAL